MRAQQRASVINLLQSCEGLWSHFPSQGSPPAAVGLLPGVSDSENVEYHSPLERFKNRGAFSSREQCLCELNVVAGPAGREACMEPSVHLLALPSLLPSRGFWSSAENLLTQAPCQAWRAESRTQYQWKMKMCQGHSPKRASPCAYSRLPEVLPVLVLG